MKILRIRFQNLNSLPSGDIDLQHGPLAQTGIFAISGPTGSGKSTILDAITLALYGKAARYDQAPNPENMMSRHAGFSQAEVLFAVSDGTVYRAEWQLRRARNRPDGKVQPATRRIYDADGTPLTQNLTESDRLVASVTGLTYERFLRSVLLAQGEFARFLKASENEQADLLESLTGTTIYSELGALAYHEATAREKELEKERHALELIALLTPEEREEKGGAVARLNETGAAIATQRDAVAQAFAAAQQQLRLQERKARLQGERGEAARQEEAARAELARLARHREGEPFYPLLGPLESLEKQLAAQQEAIAGAAAATQTVRQRLAATAAAAVRFAQGKVRESEARLAQAHQSIETGEREALALETWLREHGCDEALCAEWLTLLSGRLTTLASHRRRLAEAAAARDRLAREHAGAQAALREQEERHTRATGLAQAKAQALLEARTALDTLLGGRQPDAVFTMLETLEKRRAQLVQLREALQKRDAGAAEALQLSNTEAGLLTELEVARIQKKATQSEAHTQAHLLELARKNLAILEKMAGYETQRTTLVPGEPCPLCGAKEHPLAAPDLPVSLQIEEARRHLAAAISGNNATAKEAELATAHLARTEEALRLLQKRRGELRREQMAEHELFEQLARSLRIYTLESLTVALDKNRRARETNEALTRSIREAETAINQAEVAAVEATAGVKRLGDAIGTAREGLGQLETRRAAEEERTAALETQLAQEAAAITETLAPFSLSLPAPGDEPATLETAQARHRGYRERLARQNELTRELAQLRQQAENGRNEQETLRQQAEEMRREVPEAALAPGPETGAALPAPPWQNLDEAVVSLEAVRHDLAATIAREEERRATVQATLAALAEARSEADRALGGSPFATPEALRETRLRPDEVATLEALRERLANRSREIATQLAAVEEELERLRTTGVLPEGTALATLEGELKALGERLTETIRERTTLENALRQDEANRRSREAALKEHERRQAELGVWLRLRDLIGSSTGVKFTRFAQGLSLDLLLRHANRHLRRLNDRYRVQRMAGGGVSLEIVDQHQADTTRPMASLSGGETFLVSLALALGLSDLAGRNVRIDSLFIDEGFGSLDADTLDTAIAALDTLRLANKTVGVISHVELLKERIPVQIRVEKLPGGQSRLLLPTE
ncbi:MAG TPA: AAA family ATPase [Chthoniobacteraceae bacterium]|nr:AAA family ATPase [Chthoniobacteraceae bacterium]